MRTEGSLPIRRKFFENMVARDGAEPPTPAFSGILSAQALFNQRLNLSRWPQVCDHSVTSADVRLSVGNRNRELRYRNTSRSELEVRTTRVRELRIHNSKGLTRGGRTPGRWKSPGAKSQPWRNP